MTNFQKAFGDKYVIEDVDGVPCIMCEHGRIFAGGTTLIAVVPVNTRDQQSVVRAHEIAQCGELVNDHRSGEYVIQFPVNRLSQVAQLMKAQTKCPTP